MCDVEEGIGGREYKSASHNNGEYSAPVAAAVCAKLIRLLVSNELVRNYSAMRLLVVIWQANCDMPHLTVFYKALISRR